MNNRYDAITEKLAAIEEELRDLAYEHLADAARSPESVGASGATAEEKRLLKARRAVAKAIQALSSTAAVGDV